MMLLLQIIFTVLASIILLVSILFIIAMFKISSECRQDEAERKELEKSFKVHKKLEGDKE